MQMPPPRRVVFIDTQGWAEIFHGLALHHIQAADFLRQAQTNAWELVTSNLILSELVPLLHSRNFRLPQVQILTLVAHIRAIPTLTVAYIDRSPKLTHFSRRLNGVWFLLHQ